jgi:hypothetical protein
VGQSFAGHGDESRRLCVAALSDEDYPSTLNEALSG